MDLRESIKNIITGKENISESFKEELEKYFSNSQLVTEDEIDNTPASLPENDIDLEELVPAGEELPEE